MPSFSDLYTVYVITHYSLIKHSHMTVDAELWGHPGGWAPSPGYADGARFDCIDNVDNLWLSCRVSWPRVGSCTSVLADNLSASWLSASWFVREM